jgi:dienelactone hydrolase
MRELVIHWTMDVGRSIDYLETRGDIDATRLAYYGFSWGAWNSPVFLAIETRFQAAVLLSGGVWVERDPEVEPTNFAPRVTMPILMVNGRDDFYFSVERSQLPLFRLLGTPGQDKRHVSVEGGHIVDDFQAVVREVLDWLDRYLGPVS